MSTAYEQVIEPTRGWFPVSWKEISHYRDLLLLLVRKDFVTKFKQTVLGPAWFVIQPLLTTLVFTIVFGNFAGVSTDGLPGVPFYLAGLLLWSYFAACLPAIGSSLVVNANLFGKVYFPRIIVPFSILVANLISLGLQILTFLAFFLYYRFFTDVGHQMQLTWAVWLLPLLVFQTAMIALGCGLWLASITAKYRDVTMVMTFIVQTWMYATPVIYPLSEVPERFRILAALNPMTAVVEGVRYAFFGQASITSVHVLVSVLVTLTLLITGLALFGRIERTFVDYI